MDCKYTPKQLSCKACLDLHHILQRLNQLEEAKAREAHWHKQCLKLMDSKLRYKHELETTQNRLTFFQKELSNAQDRIKQYKQQQQHQRDLRNMRLSLKSSYQFVAYDEKHNIPVKHKDHAGGGRSNDELLKLIDSMVDDAKPWKPHIFMKVIAIARDYRHRDILLAFLKENDKDILTGSYDEAVWNKFFARFST
jgi:hypothetical protein